MSVCISACAKQVKGIWAGCHEAVVCERAIINKWISMGTIHRCVLATGTIKTSEADQLDESLATQLES